MDIAETITAKLKNLRRVLKDWASQFSNLSKTRENTKLVLNLVDTIEESMDLTLEEWNLKVILKNHLEFLLKQQKIYWQQRGDIKWAKFEDAPTNLFHARESISHRRYTISSLINEEGQHICDHYEKEKLLWETYKDRLGTSNDTNMLFNLQDLMQEGEDLTWIEEPFTQEEIAQVIAELPSNKSLGLDGFNSDFIKKC